AGPSGNSAESQISLIFATPAPPAANQPCAARLLRRARQTENVAASLRATQQFQIDPGIDPALWQPSH
ncbi:MAG TPA: hypothetical protein DCX13_12125, partial [Rhodobacteraceae bacterium]|nr:hypothetical protein [Paracoccaceae bacterium]